MNLADIRRLAARGESGDAEFKKSTTQLKRAAETPCGFLNANGGHLLFGVSPDGTIARTIAGHWFLARDAGTGGRQVPNRTEIRQE